MSTSNTLIKDPKRPTLSDRARAVGLIIDGPAHDGTYWISGLEHYRSATWVRQEIIRRTDARTNPSDS